MFFKRKKEVYQLPKNTVAFVKSPNGGVYYQNTNFTLDHKKPNIYLVTLNKKHFTVDVKNSTGHYKFDFVAQFNSDNVRAMLGYYAIHSFSASLQALFSYKISKAISEYKGDNCITSEDITEIESIAQKILPHALMIIETKAYKAFEL